MSGFVNSIFAERFPMDKTNSYRPDSVNVYYVNRIVGCVHKVDLQKSIKYIIQEKGCFVIGGSLLFLLFPKTPELKRSL